MNRYAIKRNNRNKIVGILNYDERAKKYTIEIPENVTPKEAPFMMSLFLKKGIRTMNSDWSMRWVQSRIIPSSRQNIGEILRVNGMRSYDEHKLLLKNEGRSCQDEFLDKNNALFLDGDKRLGDGTLVAVTLMIAESKPEEKDVMVKLVMNLLKL